MANQPPSLSPDSHPHQDLATPPFPAGLVKAAFGLLHQIIALIDRNIFTALVQKFQTEKGAKGFSSWDHIVSMIFAQLAGVDSLRDLVAGIASSPNSFHNLHMSQIPSKSGISYANANRDWHLFKATFINLRDRIERAISKETYKKFKFSNDLYSLDSTTIKVAISALPWAIYQTGKGAIKVHTLIKNESYLPSFAIVTDGKQGDVTIAQTMDFPKGAIVAMDRGYIKYSLFNTWTKKGIFFVTRSKESMRFDVVKEHAPVPNKPGRPKKNPDPPSGTRVISDQVVVPHTPQGKNDYPDELRLVKIHVEEDKKESGEMTFLTNNFKLSSVTISAIYKDRWQIENFFKLIKQHLVIKSFLGTTENAVQCQIWSAMIAILLIKYLQMRSSISWNFSNMIAALRINFFNHTNLYYWINCEYVERAPCPKKTVPKLCHNKLF